LIIVAALMLAAAPGFLQVPDPEANFAAKGSPFGTLRPREEGSR
jgi:hypothetical protein